MSSRPRAIAALRDGLEASGGDRVRRCDLVTMRAPELGSNLAAGSVGRSPQLAAVCLPLAYLGLSAAVTCCSHSRDTRRLPPFHEHFAHHLGRPSSLIANLATPSPLGHSIRIKSNQPPTVPTP